MRILLLGPIKALIIGSTDEWLRIGAKCYRVGGTDMGIERAHVPEDLDRLKVIGCRVLGDQDEGLHSAVFAIVLDEHLEQRLCLTHELRIHVDRCDDNDFRKTVGMSGCAHQARCNGQWQCPAEVAARIRPPTCFDALGALLVWHTAVRPCRKPAQFDQGAGSHVQRRLRQALYPSQQSRYLRQIFKSLAGGGVVPDLEQHKKVCSLDFLIGGEADRPIPAAESHQLLKELPARVLLYWQELYISDDELLFVSSSCP